MCVCASLSLSLYSLCLSVCLRREVFFHVQGLWQAAATLQGCHWFATVRGLWILANVSAFSHAFVSLSLFLHFLFCFFLSLSLSSLFLCFSLSLSLSLSFRNAMREVGKWGRARGTCDSANLRKSHLGLGLALFRRVFCVSLQWPLGILTYF